MIVTLGKLIKTIREQAGLTSQQLAALANVSQPYISQIENDRRQPSYNTLLAIAHALNTPIERFLSAGQPAAAHSGAALSYIATDSSEANTYVTPPNPSPPAGKSSISLHTLVDYALAIENAKRAHITPEELNEAVEALKKLKRLREYR